MAIDEARRRACRRLRMTAPLGAFRPEPIACTLPPTTVIESSARRAQPMSTPSHRAERRRAASARVAAATRTSYRHERCARPAVHWRPLAPQRRVAAGRDHGRRRRVGASTCPRATVARCTAQPVGAASHHNARLPSARYRRHGSAGAEMPRSVHPSLQLSVPTARDRRSRAAAHAQRVTRRTSALATTHPEHRALVTKTSPGREVGLLCRPRSCRHAGEPETLPPSSAPPAHLRRQPVLDCDAQPREHWLRRKRFDAKAMPARPAAGAVVGRRFGVPSVRDRRRAPVGIVERGVGESTGTADAPRFARGQLPVPSPLPSSTASRSNSFASAAERNTPRTSSVRIHTAWRWSCRSTGCNATSDGSDSGRSRPPFEPS